MRALESTSWCLVVALAVAFAPAGSGCDGAATPAGNGPAGAGGDAGAGGTAGQPSGGSAGEAAGSGGDSGSAGSAGEAGNAGEGGQGGSSVPIILPVEGVQVSTLAGADEGGSTDGAGEVARFRNPTNVALAPNGDMIVCDFTNGTLRRMTPDRVVSTALVQWGFFRPFGITYTPSGELYVQTDANASGVFSLKSGTIWKVDLDAQEATVVVENIGRPRGLTALPDGRLVLSDLGLHTVRIFDPTTKAIEQLAGESTKPGFVNGLGAVARFNSPYGAAVTPSGDILVADMSNHAIRRITIGGDVTTLAGDGSPGLIDGVVAQARFNRPKAVGVDDAGNIYVSDTGNHRFRRIDVNGNVMTLAGDGLPGFADGAGLQARFFGQEGFDVRPDGSALLVADGTIGQVLPYNRVRQILLP